MIGCANDSNSNYILSGLLRRYDGFNGGSCYKLLQVGAKVMQKELKMDKCREEFEKFWENRCHELAIECVLTKLINGDYYHINAYYAWIGWNQRQETMKAIRFPHKLVIVDGEYDTGYSEAYNECKDAITSAGYKVEE